ncbi:MAG: hypothetical protein QOC62_6016 [Mycobacterium sp.]|nr:hypothetical protein [Mycobacterium sp.]
MCGCQTVVGVSIPQDLAARRPTSNLDRRTLPETHDPAPIHPELCSIFDVWDPGASSIPLPTQQALQTLEWVGRRENLVVCGPAGTGKTFFLEALGQKVIEAGMPVAWFTLEQIGVLVRAHRADDSLGKAVAKIVRAELVVIDLCRPRDYADVVVRSW